MGKFKDLNEFVADEYLDLPIGGKTYRVPEADADTFVWAQSIVRVMEASSRGEEVEGAVLDDEEEVNFYGRLLSAEVYAEMLADKVMPSRIKRAAATALTWIVSDEDTALVVWESASDPEAVAAALEARKSPNRASRRASAAAARTTPKPARGSGSKASTSTPRKRPATRGTKSSNSGA